MDGECLWTLGSIKDDQVVRLSLDEQLRYFRRSVLRNFTSRNLLPPKMNRGAQHQQHYEGPLSKCRIQWKYHGASGSRRMRCKVPSYPWAHSVPSLQERY